MAQNDFWMKLKSTVKDVTTAAADFTEEQALIGKLKFEILTLNRKADRLKYHLGEIVYKMGLETPQPNPFKDSEVNGLVSDIEGVHNQIEAKRREIHQVSDHFRAKAAAAKMKNVEEPVSPKPTYSKPFVPPEDDWLEEKPAPAPPSYSAAEAKPEDLRAKEPPRKAEGQRASSGGARRSRSGNRPIRTVNKKTPEEQTEKTARTKSKADAKPPEAEKTASAKEEPGKSAT